MALGFFVTKLVLNHMLFINTQKQSSTSTLMKIPPYTQIVIALFIQQSHMGLKKCFQIIPYYQLLSPNNSMKKFQTFRDKF